MVGIRQATIEHIEKSLHVLEIDLIKGEVLNRKAYDRKGYLRMALNGKDVSVHHVIAIAGGLDVKAGLAINHKNGNKKDNSLRNLEVVTYSQNSKHAHDTKLINQIRGEEISWAVLDEEKVREIKLLLKEDKLSLKAIGDKYGVGLHAIWKIKHNKSWKHVEV